MSESKDYGNSELVIANRKQGINFKREIKLKELKEEWINGLPDELVKLGGKSDTNWLSTVTMQNDTTLEFDIIEIEKKIDEFMDTIFPFKFNYDAMNGKGETKDIDKYRHMLSTNYDNDAKTPFSKKLLKEKELEDADARRVLTELKYSNSTHQQTLAKSNPINKDILDTINNAKTMGNGQKFITILDTINKANAKAKEKKKDVMGLVGGADSGTELGSDSDQTNKAGITALCKKIEGSHPLYITTKEHKGKFIWFGELKFKYVEQEHIEALKRELLKDIPEKEDWKSITFKEIMTNCNVLRKKKKKLSENNLMDESSNGVSTNKLLEMLYDEDKTASNIFCMLVYLDLQKPNIPNKYGTIINLKANQGDEFSREPTHEELMNWKKLIEEKDMLRYGNEIKYLNLLNEISKDGVIYDINDLKSYINDISVAGVFEDDDINCSDNIDEIINEHLIKYALNPEGILTMKNAILKEINEEKAAKEKKINKKNEEDAETNTKLRTQYLHPILGEHHQRMSNFLTKSLKKIKKKRIILTGGSTVENINDEVIKININSIKPLIESVNKINKSLITNHIKIWNNIKDNNNLKQHYNEFKTTYPDLQKTYISDTEQLYKDIIATKIPEDHFDIIVEYLNLSSKIILNTGCKIPYNFLLMDYNYFNELYELFKSVFEKEDEEASEDDSYEAAKDADTRDPEGAVNGGFKQMGGVIGTDELIDITGIKSEIQVANTKIQQYLDDNQPLKGLIVKKLESKIQEKNTTVLDKIATIMVSFVNDDPKKKYKIESNKDKWYYNWSDRESTSDVMVIRRRYKWCYKLESLYLKKHYEIMFMFIQINKVYRKIYQMYYILLSLIDLDPSSKNIGEILIPYTHKPTIVDGLLPLQAEMNKIMKEQLNQGDIDKLRTNIGNISVFSDKDQNSGDIKKPDNESHIFGQNKGSTDGGIEEQDPDDLHEEVVEEEKSEVEEVEEVEKVKVASPPPAPGAAAAAEAGPAAGAPGAAPAAAAAPAGPAAGAASGPAAAAAPAAAAPEAQTIIGKIGEGAEKLRDGARGIITNIANSFTNVNTNASGNANASASASGGGFDKVNLIKKQIRNKFVQKGGNLNLKTKAKLISRLTRALNLRLDKGLHKFISKKINNPEEGLPYLGLSETGDKILVKSNIEIRNPKYYFDVVNKLEKDSNLFETYLNNAKNEENISSFESESKLKKDMILNPKNNIPEHLFNELKIESNGDKIKMRMRNPHLDLSDENHVKEVQKYLNRCHYIELLYLKKHNEFMIIYKFFFHLYKKYLIITIILLRYISLLDYKDEGNRKIGVPEEMLKPVIIDMDQIKELSGFSMLDDFSDQPSKTNNAPADEAGAGTGSPEAEAGAGAGAGTGPPEAGAGSDENTFL